MKLLLLCNECPQSSVRPFLAELEGEGVHRVTCENGHQFVHTLSNARFEILFEMALLALIDGYTREAVATLAAAVEEFYRLLIKVVLAERNMYEDKKSMSLEDSGNLLVCRSVSSEHSASYIFLRREKRHHFRIKSLLSFETGSFMEGQYLNSMRLVDMVIESLSFSFHFGKNIARA